MHIHYGETKKILQFVFFKMDKWKERRAPKGIKRNDDMREEFERDRARVIHSAAFRRLQAKTQILGVSEGDFHRTRLTHSMEVAQIGRGLVLHLQKKNPELSYLIPKLEQIETIGLAHDLGHPPFGHGGETALNYAMSKNGGFEGNGQTLRILTKLESHTKNHGLDLTRRTLLGILKYPAPFSKICRKNQQELNIDQIKSNFFQFWQPPKCFLDTEKEVINWIIDPLSDSDKILFLKYEQSNSKNHGYTLFRSLDASIMNLADDIAYGVHDFEDGIVLRLLNREHWREITKQIDPIWAKKNNLINIEKKLFKINEDSGYMRKQAIGSLVHSLISSINVKINEEFQEPLLCWSAKLPEEPMNFLKLLKDTVSKNIIKLDTVQASTFRGGEIILSLFEAISNEPEMLLPASFKKLWSESENEFGQKRIICDFISGMTDQYANRFYQRLFIPGHGSVFDRL